MWILAVVPVISAAIGYLTNVVAVRMLFHPQHPHHFLGVEIQGLVPRRKNELAGVIADMVQEEFVSGEDIKVVIRDTFKRRKFNEIVLRVLERDVQEILGKIPLGSMLRAGIRRLSEPELRNMAEDIASEILEKIIPPEVITEEIANEASLFELREYIIKKIDEYEEGRLEGILHRLGSRELRMIEAWGGMLGFLIGIVQVGILAVTQSWE